MQSNRSTSTWELLESRRLLSAGALDPSFSLDGKAANPLRIGLGNDVHTLFAADVAVQSDGKTVVAGSLQREDFGGQSDFAVARFNFDGTIDKTFGDPRFPGVAFAHLGKRHGDDLAHAVAIQPDGKILVAGEASVSRTIHADGTDFAVARFLPDGKLDNSFDDDGMRTIHFNDFSNVNDIALQSDGKIVLAGRDYDLAVVADVDENFAVARLNPDGKLDGTFNGGGKKTIGFGQDEQAYGVTIDYSGTKSTNPNFGKILLVGETEGNGNEPAFATARLNTNGTRDITFHQDGTRVTRFIGIDSGAGRDVVVQPDGKYVIAGFADADASNDGINNQFALLRYLPDGELDTSFGGAGTGLVTTGFGGDDKAMHVMRSADGGLVAGGLVNGKFAMAAYSADGVLKTSFGQAGKVVTDFGADGLANGFVGMAKGPGKRIVMAGGERFKTARYLDEGANVVSVGSFDPNAAEGGSNTASIIVGRSEKLPVPTRVFFTLGGSARAPGSLPAAQIDYDVTGMTVTGPVISRAVGGNGLSNGYFVDIPANQTFTTVTLTPRDDSLAEGTETATFTIVPNPSYQLGNAASTTLDITDNDGVQSHSRAIARSQSERDGLFSDDLINDLI